MRTPKLIVLACLWTLIALPGIAQIDTEFWFAAPEVSTSSSNFDIPIVFRISTLNAASTVVVSQPANPAFIPVTVTIAANSSANVDLSSHLNEIENKPPDTPLNYGLKITSTQPVNAYYEVVSSQCLCNPEIYALKGQNALGNYFLIPAQTYFHNSSNYYPTPYSSFIIVATNDNTAITITPAQSIVGHAAAIPFVINLNAGQTYCATATSQAAGQHLQGSVVNSSKPIAITYSDDLLYGPGGCADLAGDQIVPVAVVGSKYIVTKGALNLERVSILGTQNGTSVFLDGSSTPVTTIALGQTYEFTLSNPSVYISASHPVYVLHTSGYGCEIGIALLPSIECTGSTQIGFTRSTNELFALTLIVKNGNQDKFMLNGISNIITPSQFQPVPGTSNQWVCAQVSFTTAQIPVNQGQIVSNTGDVFHMGLINGSAGGGCRYGYFSDFSSLYLGADRQICSGDTALLDAGFGKASYLWSTGATTQTIMVNTAGQYWVQAGSGLCMFSDTIQIGIQSLPVVDLGNDTTSCEGTGYTLTAPSGFASYLWNNQPGTNVNVVTTSGLVWLKATDTVGCIARDTVLVTFMPSLPVSVTVTASANPVCQGDTVHYTAHVVSPGFSTVLQWFVNGIPVSSGDITTGLIAYYPFNGNANDASGNGNNATEITATPTTDRFGNQNSAYNFAGLSNPQIIKVPNSPTLQFGNQGSFSLWVHMNSYYGMNGWGSATANGYHMLFSKDFDRCCLNEGLGGFSNGKFSSNCYSNGWYSGILLSVDTVPGSSLGQWYNITYVFTPTEAKMFSNGQLIATKSGTTTFANSNSKDLYFGRLSSFWYPLNGKLDDIRFYNRALSNAEVLMLYQGFDSTFSYVPQNGDIVTCVATATGPCLLNNPDTSNAITMIVHPLPANLGQATSSLSQGLVASYPFSGNANDESGNGNNGVVHGASLASDRYGNSANAYSFDGINDYIGCGDAGSLAIHGDISVCAWVKSSSSSTAVIIAKYGGPSTDAGWELNTYNNRIQFDGRDHSNTYLSSGVTDQLGNTWHFVVGERENSTWKIYYDGLLANSFNAGSSGDIYSALPLEFGRELNNIIYWGDSLQGYWYNGLLDDIRLYNRALSVPEITCLYSGNCLNLTASLYSDSICTGNNTSLSILNSQTGIKYQMLSNGVNYGAYQIGNGDTLTFPINGLMQTESFTMLATNTTTSCFTMLDSTFTVYVSAMNAVVSPAATICSGTNTTISASGGTGYIWSNGMTTASITVSPTATTVYYVTVTNGTWCMDSDSVKVNVNPSPVAAITGLNVICLGATNITYTTQPGMTGYAWTVSGGGAITAGAGTNTITVTWNSLGAQSVGVSFTNSLGCATIVPALLSVTVNPMPAPVITGNSSMCVASGYYDYITEPGMANYTWSISPGGTILYGNGTNGLIVTWDVPGPQWVKVNYTNSSGCTATIPTQLNVTVNPLPGAAGTVMGSGTVCAGATGITYSTQLIPDAVTYVWSLPFGASISSGSGTNNILVDFGPTTQSGDITVYGNNLCGNGTVSVPFHVNVSALPGLAGTPTGDEVVCQGDTGIIYYVSPILNAVNYVWDITGGGVITTGNGTNSIRAEFPAGPANCAVTVYGSNSCGAGLISPAKYVTVNLLPPAPVITQNGPELVSSAPAGNQWYFNGTLIPGADQATYTPTLSGTYTVIVTLLGCSSSASDGLYFIMTAIEKPQPFTVKVYPVPNDGKFRVYLNSGEAEQVKLYVMNALGQKIWELPGIELNGNKQQTIDLRPVPPGVYTLVIEGDSLRVVRKVVVE